MLSNTNKVYVCFYTQCYATYKTISIKYPQTKSIAIVMGKTKVFQKCTSKDYKIGCYDVIF